MKTTVKQLAAGTFVALLFLVGNVNAEGTEAKAFSRETETTLQVEKWMTDEDLWNTKSFSITEISQETETSLELENWMTSAETWNFSNNFVEETETSMELECWMTCDKIWNGYKSVVETETELTIENWMINENFWNK
jgi:hypothetical protein